MDSLRGIPVEHKLETFSMPSTGTTSCHPKNWLCRSERNSALDNMQISQTLLQIPDTKLHGDFKHIPHTFRNTRCRHISLRHFVYNTNKPKHHESCSTKSKPYSKLQIKNFRCCVVKEKFRNSVVLPKIYRAKQITISPTAIYLQRYIHLPTPSTMTWGHFLNGV